MNSAGSRLKFPGTVLLVGAVVGTLAITGVASKVSVDPASAASGSATLRIGAKPIKLKQASDPQLGTLTPAPDAASAGMFGPQIEWPVVPIHIALARNGHLISYGTPLNNGTTQGGLLFDNWDPKAGLGPESHADSDSMGYDSFCNSLVALADGRLLMVGGNSSMSTMIYNPFTGGLTMGANLKHQRWYATTLRLPSGHTLVLGGTDTYNRHTTLGLPPGATDGTVPEIDANWKSWTSLTGAASVAAFGRASSKWFYPRAFNGPNGTVVGFSNDQLWELTTGGKGKVKLTGKLPYKPYASESQVMYSPGKVLVISGGSGNPKDHTVASKRALIVDFTGKKPVMKSTGNVLYPGNWLNATVLPNGEVYVNGGTGLGTSPASANRTGQIWNPTSGKWRKAATAQRIRTYHSTSLLLPSGAVFTGGGGAGPYTDSDQIGPENNLNAELYYPAYLFEKAKDGSVKWAPRPAVTSISGNATYGGKIKLGLKDSAKITGASLTSLPSVTHSENTDQRRISLSFKQVGNSLTATLPKSINQLPPGDYELSVTNAKGVPSAAQILTIRNGAAGSVTVS